MRRRLRWTLTLAVQAGTRHLASSPLAAAAGGHGGEHDVSPSQRLVLMVSSVGLVVTAGLMSGLTLGLMSMDVVELEVLKRSGTPREQTYAATITPILANQHFLLVTLLLCNAVSMEALPLFLDRLADPVTAILISVTAVLVFGEILPQAVCSRYGLAIGYYCAWLVRLLMAATSPISWPIGKLLDVLLGAEHRALFRRGQLKALVDIHGADEGLGGNLTEDEIKVICGALDLTSKTARKSMTPLNKVFMLPADARLNQQTMRAILASGHSRIPVYTRGDRSSIIGLILVKELLQYKTHQEVPVSEVRMRSLPRLPADTPMYDMLKLFQTGRSHMVVLTDTPATARAAAAANAASAAADAAAAAADADSDADSDGGSEAGSDGSPLGGMLRRKKKKSKKKKRKNRIQFESPLLQPIETPQPPDDGTEEQQQQQAAAVADANSPFAAGGGKPNGLAGSCGDDPQQQQRAAAQAAWLDHQPLSLLLPAHSMESMHSAGTNCPSSTRSSDGGCAAGVPPALRASRSGSSNDGRSRGRVQFREHGGHSTLDADAAAQPAQQQQPDSANNGAPPAAPIMICRPAGGPSRSNSGDAGSAGSGGRSLSMHSRSKSGPMLLSLAIGQEGEAHADVAHGPEGVAVPIGIITIEDVIEELISQEIVDETDLFVDNERSITVNAAALAQSLPLQLRLALQSPQHHASGPGGVAGALAGAAAAAAAMNTQKVWLLKQKSLSGLAAAVGGVSGGSSGSGQAASGPGARLAAAGLQGSSGSGGVPAVLPGSAAPSPAAAAGADGVAGPGPLAASGSSVAAAVTSGLAAAAAAVAAGRGSGSGGAERQPLLSATDRAAPSTRG